MAKPDRATTLRELCESVTEKPIEQLVSHPDWGRVNFEGAGEDLKTIFGIANQLKNLPVELLPDGEINPLIHCLQQVSEQVGSIRKFSIEQANPTGVRDGIVTNLRNHAEQLYTQSQARIPFLAVQRGDVKRNEEALARAVTKADELNHSAVATANESKAELEKIIAAAREASASVGVAVFTGDFKKTADDLGISAGNWLKLTAIFAAITILTAGFFPVVFPITEAGFTLTAIQIFTSKVVVLGALFAATIWIGRMYKATKHQESVNRHRENGLKTFQAFVKAASDDQTRNAVLIETTRSIFSITNTGYLDGAESPHDGGAVQILELIKSSAKE